MNILLIMDIFKCIDTKMRFLYRHILHKSLMGEKLDREQEY